MNRGEDLSGAGADRHPQEREGSRQLAATLGRNVKGKLSVVVYLVAVPLAFVDSWLACGLYVLVAVMWLVPDPRIEKTLPHAGGE